MKRNLKAVELVKVIRQHGVIIGYAAAGKLAGEENAQARDWGQVCSLTDYACFIAGLPAITVEYVRKADGDVNDKSFQDVFSKYKDEIVTAAREFVWTDAAYTKLMSTLLTMDDTNAVNEWQGVIQRERKQAGFIRYQLDRAARAAN
jgi:hypothetical protein